MTALQLDRYLRDNSIEWSWIDQHKDIQDVVIFPYIFQLNDFIKLFSASDFDEDGIECRIKGNYIAIKMRDLLELHDIELSEIFPIDEPSF